MGREDCTITSCSRPQGSSELAVLLVHGTASGCCLQRRPWRIAVRGLHRPQGNSLALGRFAGANVGVISSGTYDPDAWTAAAFGRLREDVRQQQTQCCCCCCCCCICSSRCGCRSSCARVALAL